MRRIPGPANDYHQSEQKQNNIENSQLLSARNSPSSYGSLSYQSEREILLTSELFWQDAWRNACEDEKITIVLKNQRYYLMATISLLQNVNLDSAKMSVDRVNHLGRIIVVVASLKIDWEGHGEVMDPFGSMQAVFSKQVLDAFSKLSVGTCLVLKNPVIYQPSDHDFYLVIGVNDVEKMYTNEGIFLNAANDEISGDKTDDDDMKDDKDNETQTNNAQLLFSQFDDNECPFMVN